MTFSTATYPRQNPLPLSASHLSANVCDVSVDSGCSQSAITLRCDLHPQFRVHLFRNACALRRATEEFTNLGPVGTFVDISADGRAKSFGLAGHVCVRYVGSSFAKQIDKILELLSPTMTFPRIKSRLCKVWRWKPVKSTVLRP